MSLVSTLKKLAQSLIELNFLIITPSELNTSNWTFPLPRSYYKITFTINQSPKSFIKIIFMKFIQINSYLFFFFFIFP